MIKIFIDLQNFLLACAPLLTSTALFALFAILLSKSIKKHAALYYTAFAIPFALVAIPTVLRWCGVSSFGFTGVPVLGQILRDYIHMGTLGHPLLIIIMYMGALDMKNPSVRKLMSIRKELSIISGFPILAHSLIRVANNFPSSLKFFTNHEQFMASGRVVSELGAGINSFSMVLGVAMLALFIPLWITSFDAVHKRMGGVRWKKLQKWSYVLYATLFIHAICIQVGGILNPRGGARHQTAVEAVAAQDPAKEAGSAAGRPGNHRAETPNGERRGAETVSTSGTERGGQDAKTVSRTEALDKGVQAAPQPNARRQAKGFSDFQIGGGAKHSIHIVSLVLIYGSYLFLRLRKARNAKRRRMQTEGL